MGYLLYDGREYEFEDRWLAHLKVAVGTKFRRHESFFMSWKVDPMNGSGRISLWMDPSQHVGFRFSGSKAPKLNKEWLKVLVDLAGTHRGLIAITEKDAEAYAKEQREQRESHEVSV